MTTHAGPAVANLEDDGYEVVDDALTEDRVSELRHLAASAAGNGAGTRRMLDLEWCRRVAGELLAVGAVRRYTTPDAQPVLCTFFIKDAINNWLVALHQDLSIPVATRVDSPRCSGWAEKEGELFVQPPTEVLDQIVAVRLHLDDCDETNGALRVVPGSHRYGRLSTDDAKRVRDRAAEISVPVPAGGAMLMRPLLLHASSKSLGERPRHVLHFVFGPRVLPDGLDWPSPKQTVSSV